MSKCRKPAFETLECRLPLATIAYEGFEYPQTIGTPVDGLNGGQGFTGAFDTSGPELSAGLTLPDQAGVGKAAAYTAGSQTFGLNSPTGPGGRPWGATTSAPEAGTYWYSLLLNATGSNPRGTFVIMGKPNDVQNGLGLRLDTDAGVTTVKAWTPHQAAGGSITIDRDTSYRIVGKIEIASDGSSTNRIWVNPDLSSEPTSGGSTVSSSATSTSEVRKTLSGRAFTNSTGPVIDEITIGTEWTDVATPVASLYNEQIILNQIGYRPDAVKVAVFADPIVGQNAAVEYIPGPQFQVRRVSDDAVVFTGPTVQWKNGQTDVYSGDRVWHGDFSAVTEPGSYYIYDPTTDTRSFAFDVAADAYNGVLEASVRMFYYQRFNQEKTPEYAGVWTHALDHSGPNQDTQARLWINGALDPNAPVLDLRGGWFDAGDYNKYVPFASTTLWNLMDAYETNPLVFADNYNIPESGNNVPDLLDEVKYELDWLLRMQRPGGGVLNRVGNGQSGSGNADPATNTQARYYTQETTWSTATFAAAAAQASRIFANFEATYPGYAQTLLTAAENAWAYLQAHPNIHPLDGTDGDDDASGNNGISAADAGASTSADFYRRVMAAAQLWKTTGDVAYKNYFEANYNVNAGSHHPLQSGYKYFDGILSQDLNSAFITYATTPGANATIVNQIKNSLRETANGILLSAHNNQTDPYRSYMWDGHYTWGSNQFKSQWAALLLSAIRLNVSPANNATYFAVAEEYIHYFLGRNPLSYVHLTNLGEKGANLGAEKSIMEIWHYWFADGSKWDGANSQFGPAPGYLSGGANQFYSVPNVTPTDQPTLKSYDDWNTSWPDKAWEITEPAIYYQAAFVRLLSAFAAIEPPASAGDYDRNGSVNQLDFTVWTQGFGATSGTGLAADGSADGRVDAADYTVWRDNLSTPIVTAAAAVVAALDAPLADKPLVMEPESPVAGPVYPSALSVTALQEEVTRLDREAFFAELAHSTLRVADVHWLYPSSPRRPLSAVERMDAFAIVDEVASSDEKEPIFHGLGNNSNWVETV